MEFLRGMNKLQEVISVRFIKQRAESSKQYGVEFGEKNQVYKQY